MKKKTFIIIIVLVLSALLTSVFVYAELNNNYSASKVAVSIKDIFDSSNASTVVAEVNYVPIYAYQIELKRVFNDYAHSLIMSEYSEIDADYAKTRVDNTPIDKNGIIMQLAKAIVLEEESAKAGILISDEDVIDIIREENEYVQSEVQSGNELMIKRVMADEKFISDLDMTRDEFNKYLYFDVVRNREIFMNYAYYYYSIPENSKTSFEAHVENLLKQATIVIK